MIMNTTDCDNLHRINQVAKVIESGFSENHDIQYYANLCNMERKYFITIFRQYMGVSPRRFRTSLRIEEAKRLLINTDMNSKDIALTVGYSDPLYFSRVFKKYEGIL